MLIQKVLLMTSMFLQVMCRCATPLENSVKEKISMFCHVEPTQVKYCSRANTLISSSKALTDCLELHSPSEPAEGAVESKSTADPLMMRTRTNENI